MQINGKEIISEGALPRIARLDQEWFEDLDNPEILLASLQKNKPVPDILTFWQRLPETKPKYSYKMEPDPIAALPITTYSNWWDKQVDSSARNKVRKAQRKGVVIRLNRVRR